MADHDTAYLTARLDQLHAASRDHDAAAAMHVIERLIRDDHPAARAAIAQALHAQTGRQQPTTG